MKKIILAAAVAALASFAVTASASAGVERYQTQYMTITAVQPEGAVGQWQNVWTHTYNVELNPCDNSFSGVGSLSGTINGPYSNETITGHLDGNKVSYTATRPDGVVYSLSNALLDNTTVTLATSTPVAPWALEFKVSKTMGATSNYKSQSDYVSQGGGADAAHSCIGMAKSGPADSVLGSIVYNNDSFGLASFSFAGQAGGKGTAFYADKSGYYSATATKVEVLDGKTATMSLTVTSSKHPAVPVGTQFTVTLHDEPGTLDYFTIDLDHDITHFVAKAGNILVNYR